MCKRFTFQIPSALLTQMFGLAEHPTVFPRYNIAATQQVPTIRQDVAGLNQFDYMHWGLIPSWTKNRSVGSKMVNARSLTLMDKPAFRQAVQYQRCLVIASGYYDWELVGNRMQPMYIHLKGSSLMVFAGLWDSWKSSRGEVVVSCTILTINSGQTTRKPRWSLIEPHEHRMPVILHPDEYLGWLDRNATDPASLAHLYRQYPADLMEKWPVSPLVNSLKNDSADLIIPFYDFPHHSKEPDEKDQG